MNSVIIKRSVMIGGRKTSVSLENQFWWGLKEIALQKRITVSQLIAEVDAQRMHENLSSALRLHLLHHYRAVVASRADAAQPEMGPAAEQGPAADALAC